MGAQAWYTHRHKVVLPDKPVDEQALNQWLETGEINGPVDDKRPDWMTEDNGPEEKPKL